MDKKIIVIDLDGTFVNVNTFHKWMQFLFIKEIKKFNIISTIKISYIICLRYLKLIDHQKMKFLILKISEKVITKEDTVNFVKSLSTSVNSDILKVVQDGFNTTILATAAPILYSKVIKEIYEFDYVIATGSTDRIDWKENIREEKKKNLIALLKKRSIGSKISILYTDHHDDLPLMKYSDYTYLVNASKKTKKLVRDSNIQFNHSTIETNTR